MRYLFIDEYGQISMGDQVTEKQIEAADDDFLTIVNMDEKTVYNVALGVWDIISTSNGEVPYSGDIEEEWYD